MKDKKPHPYKKIIFLKVKKENSLNKTKTFSLVADLSGGKKQCHTFGEAPLLSLLARSPAAMTAVECCLTMTYHAKNDLVWWFGSLEYVQLCDTGNFSYMNSFRVLPEHRGLVSSLRGL